MKHLTAPVRFVRLAMRGHWLRPWRNPYIRWRIETYSGVPAESVDAGAFFRFIFTEKSRLFLFLRWTAEMEEHARPQAKRP